MILDPEEELKRLDKQIQRNKIIGMPGILMFGLGMFAKFEENPEGLHALLGNPDFVNGLLIVGGLIAAWEFIQLISIIQRRAPLRRQLESREQ